VDIAKAFDTVSWLFLFELLAFMSFSHRWINWMTVILSTASTCILLNNQSGQQICHARGLRQGDQLSPLLFVIVMEALNGLFRFTDSSGLLSPLWSRAIKHRVSLYVDDLVVFVAPVHQDIHLVHAILEAFAGASGLHTSIHKCQITLVCCRADQIELVQSVFPC
jgi:hypothetical protein